MSPPQVSVSICFATLTKQIRYLRFESLAATQVSDEVLAELRQVVERQQALAGSPSNIDEQVGLDVRFHEVIAAASRNA